MLGNWEATVLGTTGFQTGFGNGPTTNAFMHPVWSRESHPQTWSHEEEQEMPPSGDLTAGDRCF